MAPRAQTSQPKPVLMGFPPITSFKEGLLWVLVIGAMSALQPFVKPYNDAAANYIIWAVTTFVTTYYGRLALEAAFLGAAYGLYRLKKSKQRLYGSLECGFAVLTGWLVFDRLSAAVTVNEVVALVGAGYLLVRGLTNYSEGREKSLVIPKGATAEVSPG